MESICFYFIQNYYPLLHLTQCFVGHMYCEPYAPGYHKPHMAWMANTSTVPVVLRDMNCGSRRLSDSDREPSPSNVVSLRMRMDARDPLSDPEVDYAHHQYVLNQWDREDGHSPDLPPAYNQSVWPNDAEGGRTSQIQTEGINPWTPPRPGDRRLQPNDGLFVENKQGPPPQRHDRLLQCNEWDYPPQRDDGLLQRNEWDHPPQRHDGLLQQNERDHPPQRDDRLLRRNERDHPPQRDDRLLRRNERDYPPHRDDRLMRRSGRDPDQELRMNRSSRPHDELRGNDHNRQRRGSDLVRWNDNERRPHHNEDRQCRRLHRDDRRRSPGITGQRCDDEFHHRRDTTKRLRERSMDQGQKRRRLDYIVRPTPNPTKSYYRIVQPGRQHPTSNETSGPLMITMTPKTESSDRGTQSDDVTMYVLQPTIAHNPQQSAVQDSSDACEHHTK